MDARGESSVYVIVSSSDGYEDCWAPFFALLEKYWPDRPWPVMLITGKKKPKVIGRDVRSFQAADSQGNASAWSECLAACLGSLRSKYVLYLQEDYFVEEPVNTITLLNALEAMERHDYAHIGLTSFGSGSPLQRSACAEWLWDVGKRARYRVNLQAGLWLRETLKSYCRPGETAWQFEKFGTWRSWRRRNERFGTLNQHLLLKQPCILYTGTGIVRGQWHKAIPNVFGRNGIEVDFSRRGFYEGPRPLVSRLETAVRVFRSPLRAARALMYG